MLLGPDGSVQKNYVHDLPALNPPLAYLPEDGYYLQMISDPDGDISGATYDTTLRLQDVVSLGTPTTDDPVTSGDQMLYANTGMSFFSYMATSGEKASLSLTPSGANLQAEIWVLEFGFHNQSNWYSRADYPELGLQVSQSAMSSGQPVSLEHIASYDGMIVIMVRDASGSGLDDSFDIEASIIP